MALQYPKPRQSTMGWIQGTCSRCNATDKPLVRHKTEYVCSTCVRTIIRSEAAKKQIKEDEREGKLWEERTTPAE